MSEKIYSKEGTKEVYQSNGHYRINSIDYMSIWTFKNKYQIKENTNDINAADSKELVSRGIGYEISVPDLGRFPTVKIFKVDDLEQYYGFE